MEPVLLAARFGMDLRMALGILELLGGGEMALHFSDVSEVEDFRNARTGVFWIFALRAGVFCDVRHGGMAGTVDSTIERPANYGIAWRGMALAAGGFFLFEGVIRSAHKRAGFDVLESHLLTQTLVLGEFVRMYEAHDGQVFPGWLKILA
jgi:hypothetical protein